MFGFATKIGMTRIFLDGKTVPVTVLQFLTQYVLQRKNEDKDGYKAIQIGTGYKSKRQTNQALRAHLNKYNPKVQAGLLNIGEFRDVELPEDKTEITIADFAEGDTVHLSAKTIGRGFAGAVKRHGFRGQPASHGHDHVRAVGSIGSRWPQRVLPGKKMAGHMGNVQRTLRHVKILAIDPEKNLLFVKGSVPGANQGVVKITKSNPSSDK
jgi:large subunit ribosomal protein L3